MHKVEITPSTIYVHRGLRPVARGYPRPPYDVIVNLDTTVHLDKAGSTSLIKTTASPNLSKDEARWVAQEMRRACGRRCRGEPCNSARIGSATYQGRRDAETQRNRRLDRVAPVAAR